VRTGGERRLSNFLLYEMAYAELDFVDEVKRERLSYIQNGKERKKRKTPQV
jgi:undecaprenyl diphosphate synthase